MAAMPWETEVNMNILNTLQEVSSRTHELIMANYGKKLKVRNKKNPGDFVTEVDEKAQEIIKESLLQSFVEQGMTKNSIGFIGEESLTENIDAEHLFIIDPIDGTSSFVAGDNSGAFATSIAYARNREILVGFIYDHLQNIQYFAQKGKGAYKIVDGKKTALTYSKNINKIIGFNKSRDIQVQDRLNEELKKANSQQVGIKRGRSCVLSAMKVVTGDFSLLYSSAFIWDFAVSLLILSELGVPFSTWDDTEFIYDWSNPQKRYFVKIGAL